MLTTERTEAISRYLTSDKSRELELVTMEPEEALERIHADGYDFTLDELKEFGEGVRTVASQEGELSDEDLANVSGGSVTVGAILGVGFLITVCYDVGKIVGEKIPW